MEFALSILLVLSINYAQAQNHSEANDHAAHHANHSDHKEKTEKSTESAKTFAPTPELKVRMEKILTLMRELEAKSSDKKMVIEYGSKLKSVVDDIFKTCKLEPDADAAIHPSLGLILAGSAEFKKGDFKNGHEKIHEALMKYQKLFTHEGWKH